MRNKIGQFTKGHPPHPNWIKKWTKPKKEIICPVCKKLFILRITSKQKTCSKICGDILGSQNRTGNKSWNWKGGIQNNHGYLRMTTGDKQYLHRKVMEDFLGRKLLKNEHIHHINGNKQDNRLENLTVILNGEHQKIHWEDGKHFGKLKCSFCKKTFIGYIRNKSTKRFCSKKCYRDNPENKEKIKIYNKKYRQKHFSLN
ncbi:MAG: HNH endonuclease [Candidatus Pacebacteria bacterium]|nr:HNH endonuclease [Candidatus Paceibacterota bacterium]NUQ57512.1 HNH endonuclease [Candidatus Paceibacter sp.]